jgi:hypothetical protein
MPPRPSDPYALRLFRGFYRMAQGRLQFARPAPHEAKGSGPPNFEIDKPPEIWKAFAFKVPQRTSQEKTKT